MYEPDAPYIHERGLKASVSPDGKKVMRTFTFSNGETYDYVTYDGLVVDGDMILGSHEELQASFLEYEAQLKDVSGQGAMANKCNARFIA